eukprot:scaffold22653_cov119-Cylindrotheca_fusiformis.AAC.18
MSARPVYIPPGKRKSSTSNKPERFHGAFTGGFSAGYFNTVDTKEGWKPSTEKRKEQHLEDFMDDQDHVEWGGPTKVRQDYNSSKPTKDYDPLTTVTAPKEPLDTFFKVSHQSVGPRLLRKLGWREEGGTAFVPVSRDEENIQTKKDDDDEMEAAIVLSKKKLKKIKLQTKRVQIPPPKLDTCGLGFAPHKNAPEFRQYHERRKQLARERGVAGGSNDNVYRLSALLTEPSAGVLGDGTAGTGTAEKTDDYLTYETAEDFVGKRSVGGFSLRDDDDDAYDNSNPTNGRKPTEVNLGDEYNTEIYEHEESDEEDVTVGTVSFDPSKTSNNDGGLQQSKTDLGGILSSWANTSSISNHKSVALTSDGKPPLEGFVLGGSMESHKKRFPGPDIPRDYTVKRHVFGENEHPLIYQTIARAVQLQEQEQRRQKVQKRRQEPLVVGGAFSNLASAMKNRFTSSKKEESISLDRVGLYKPDPAVVEAKRQEEDPPVKNPEPSTKQPIVLERTLQSFIPHPLLCKRFGVPVPKNVMGSSLTPSATVSHVPDRVTEANYFQTEILDVQKRDDAKQTKGQKPVKAEGMDQGDDDDNNSNTEVQEGALVVQRPSMDKLKSIFEPDSDSESSTDLDASSSDGEDEEDNEAEKDNTAAVALEKNGTAIIREIENDNRAAQASTTATNWATGEGDSRAADNASVSSDSQRRDRRHHRKKSHHHHRRHSKKRRRRSPEKDVDDGNDEEEERRRRRRRKDKSHKHDRKRRKKSSRRKKESDEGSVASEGE